jgi:small-conductance mechanosensitive channel
MPVNRNVSYYVGSLITSLIGGILLLVTDFAGWYNYSYYTRTWGWVGMGEFPYGILFVIPAFFLFYCSYISVMALKNTDKDPKTVSLLLGIMLSFVVFILALIGGIIFILTVSDVDEWWFSEAFYGGLLGGLLTFLFLYFALKNINLSN